VRARAASAALLAGALALAACGDDGRALAPAPPTTASTSTTTLPAAPPSIAGPMRVSSVDVPDGGTLPRDLTCEGADEAPSLAITGAPEAAAELAVAVVDVTAGGTVHWVVAGLPGDLGVLEPSALPVEAVQGRSATGVVGWDGPCLAPGQPAHRFEVRAYALSEPSGLVSGVDGGEAVKVLERAAIERATLSATYGAEGEAPR